MAIESVLQENLSESESGAFAKRVRLVRDTLLGDIRIEETFTRDPQNGSYRLQRYTPMSGNRIVVTLAPDVPFDMAQSDAIRMGFGNLERIGKTRSAVLALGSADTVEAIPLAIEKLQRDAYFLASIEPDYLARKAQAVYPNDRLWGRQRHFDGGDSGLASRDIDAPEAWGVQRFANDVIIAFLDSGLRLTHEDLVDNLWRNEAEQLNGLDDDGNGYVDDLHGINAIAGTGDPTAEGGHGTLVAGVAGARGNNGLGTTGVVWQTNLMPLKFLNRHGVGFVSDAIECLDYAISHGADIINNSWGSQGDSLALKVALQQAAARGVLMATAAGNDARWLSEFPVYPASYDISTQVVVAASNEQDKLANFSNYDPLRVHLTAPYYTYTTSAAGDREYETAFGTSISTPFVSGSLALLKSHFPSESPLELIDRLLDGVDFRPTLQSSTLSMGRLNLHRPLAGLSNIPSNDNFQSASVIEGGNAIATGSLTFATSESSEPAPAPTAQGHTVWYHWTSPRQTAVTLEMRSLSVRSAVAIYQGSELAGLARVASLEETSLSGVESVVFETQANATYVIQVDHLEERGGPFSLQLILAPENDNLAAPTQLIGEGFRLPGSNAAATKSETEPSIHQSGAGRSVWYRWTAPKSGSFYVAAESLAGQTYLDIFQGPGVSALQPAASEMENGLPSRRLFSAAEGETYYFGVDSLSRDGLAFELSGLYLDGPIITSQPSDQQVALGESALFSVAVFGGHATYQWFKDGAELSGETNAYLDLANVTEEDVGEYFVRIAAANRQLVSRLASLAIKTSAGRFIRQPDPQVVVQGNPFQMNALLASSVGETYQWHKDGEPIAGADGPTYRKDSATLRDSGFYKVDATLGDRSVSSRSVYVDVVEDRLSQGLAWIPDATPKGQFRVFEAVNGYFVALGDTRMAFSTDGEEWYYTSSPVGQNVYTICFGNGLYVAGGEQAPIYSIDLKRWTAYDTHIGAIRQVAFARGSFWAATSQGLFKSADATDWSAVAISPENSGKSCHGIGWDGETIIVTTDTGPYRSLDGESWSPMGSNLPRNQEKIFHANGRWWAFNDVNRSASRSDDGVAWTGVSFPSGFKQTISFDPPRSSISILSSDAIYRWSDGQWELVASHDGNVLSMGVLDGSHVGNARGRLAPLRELGFTSPPVEEHSWWESVFLTASDKEFIASGASAVRLSEDAIDWRIIRNENSQSAGEILSGNGVYVSGLRYGPSVNSTTEHGRILSAFAFGNGVFAAIHQGLINSRNGKDWEPSTGAYDISSLRHLSFAGDRFFVDDSDKVYTSEDGRTWVATNLDAYLGDRFYAFGGGLYIAVFGQQSHWSQDGVQWHVGGRISRPYASANCHGLAYINGRFVASYAGGIIFDSEDGVSWHVANAAPNAYNVRHVVSNSRGTLLAGDGLALIGAGGGGGIAIEVDGQTSGSKVLAGTKVRLNLQGSSADGEPIRYSVATNRQSAITLPPGANAYEFQAIQSGAYSLRVTGETASNLSATDSIEVVAVSPLATQLPLRLVGQIVEYKGAVYACTQGGIIMMTTDGEAWITVQTPSTYDIVGLQASELGICAADERGGLLFSTNGVNWSLIENMDARRGLARAPEGFFAIEAGMHGMLLSPDGQSWLSRRSGELLAGRAARPRPDLETLFGHSIVDFGFPGATSSYEGISIDSYPVIDYVNRANDHLLLTGLGVYRTTEGKIFEDVTPGGAKSQPTYQRIDSAGDTLFLIEGDIGTRSLAYLSSDATDWLPLPQPIEIRSTVAFRDGAFYVMTHQGFASSQSGLDWRLIGPTSTISADYLRNELLATSFGFFEFYNVEDRESGLAFSRDGIDWTANQVAYRDGIRRIVGKEGSLFAVNDDLRLQVFHRTDKSGWQPTDTKMTHQAIYGLGKFVDVNHNGRGLHISSDGMNWENYPMPGWLYPPDSRSHLLFDGQKHFWSGYERQSYARSPDGISWENFASPNGEELKSIVYFGNRHIALFGPVPYYSEDNGVSWTAYSGDDKPSSVSSLAATNHGLGMFLDSTPIPYFWYSENGLEWKKTPAPVNSWDLVSTPERFYIGNTSVASTVDGSSWIAETQQIAWGLLMAVGDHVFHLGKGLTIREVTRNDIAIAHMSMERSSVGVGETVSASMEIANLGPKRFQSDSRSSIEVALSEQRGAWGRGQDGFIHTQIIKTPHLSLESGSRQTVEATVEIPDGIPPGEYYLSARLGDAFSDSDSNRTNDIALMDGPPPVIIEGKRLDLTIEGSGTVLHNIRSLESVARKQTILLTPRSHPGHRFKKWDSEYDYEGDVLAFSMEKDVSIKATFVEDGYVISATVFGPGSITGIPEKRVEFGQSVQLQAVPHENASFRAWSGDYSGSQESIEFPVGNDIEIFATFQQTFSQWQRGRFSEAELDDDEISGPDGDPDGNGISNLWDYLLGSPVTQPDPSNSLRVFVEDNYLCLIYPLSLIAKEFTVRPVFSADLNTFSQTVVEDRLVQSNGAYELREARAPLPEGGTLFITLEATQQVAD